MTSSRLCFLLYWLLAGALVLVLTLWAAHTARGAISDCHDATCRITTADGSAGSGCVFEISQGQVFVLTAAHVVGRHRTVACEFWRGGHQSQRLPGEVVLRVENDRCDAAVVAVPESQFGACLPQAIPVAPPDLVLAPGATITSVGCANAAWSTGWKGHVLGYSDGDLHFLPTPANGRSGSAIFDADGRQIVGLLRARTVNDSEGIACNLESLYAGLGRAVAEQSAQCGPRGCPAAPSAPRYRALPYRQKQEFERFQEKGPWPTLPPGPQPKVELDETNRKLDRIADVVVDIRSQRTQPAAEEAKEKSTLSAVGVVLTVLGALLVGGIAFYATQNHTPIE